VRSRTDDIQKRVLLVWRQIRRVSLGEHEQTLVPEHGESFGFGAGPRLVRVGEADEVEDEHVTKLKAALWFSIGKIVDEESLRLDANATPQFIGALTEMAWTQIENIAADLEGFSRHAGRTTVNTDDVLLITRRNDALHGIMKDVVDKESVKKGKQKAGGRPAAKR